MTKDGVFDDLSSNDIYKLDLAFLAILDLPLSLLGLSSCVFQLLCTAIVT